MMLPPADESSAQRPPTLAVAIVTILVAAYAIALILLITTARRMTTLAPQVARAETAAEQATGGESNSVQTLSAQLAAERQRQTALLARLPRDVQAGVFDQVAQDARQTGITGFSYQRKNDYAETMQAGTYRVYRFTIQGRGSQEQVMRFLDGLFKDSGPAIIIENIILQPAGLGLQFSADILVYSFVVQ